MKFMERQPREVEAIQWDGTISTAVAIINMTGEAWCVKANSSDITDGYALYSVDVGDRELTGIVSWYDYVFKDGNIMTQERFEDEYVAVG